MPHIDIFSNSAFDMASLTLAIDKLPRSIGRLGQMNLFKTIPTQFFTAEIEERHGKLSLIQSASRGTVQETNQRRERKMRSFSIPHLPFDDAVLATEVEGVRSFGKENEMETVANIVNEKLTALKQAHEDTWEWHRNGAIAGIVLDADGSTMVDWFTEFGIAEKVIDYDLDNAAAEVILKCTETVRHIRTALGGSPFSGVHAFCGNSFFDKLTTHTSVKEAFLRWQDGAFFRTGHLSGPAGAQSGTQGGGFMFGDITWENYDYTVGGTPFVATDECRFVPVGARDLFVRVNAPADFAETVNTLGKPIYAKQEKMKYNKGVELHTQSNPLHICTRPAALVKGTET